MAIYDQKTLEDYARIKVNDKVIEIFKEIDNFMDFHQKKQATFSTDALIKHLIKKFL